MAIGKEVISISTKIKVSYTDSEELQEVKDRLQPMIEKVREPKNEKGGFKKAYIDLKDKKVPYKT